MNFARYIVWAIVLNDKMANAFNSVGKFDDYETKEKKNFKK